MLLSARDLHNLLAGESSFDEQRFALFVEQNFRGCDMLSSLITERVSVSSTRLGDKMDEG
jgi:hypothetical protein